MKAIVTGSGGFIGAHLCALLHEQGHEVVEIDKKKGVDIGDTAHLVKLFAGSDVVFHLAAEPSVQLSIEHPQETHVTNVDGTLSVLEAARLTNVKRVVFSSSAAIYGDSDVLPTTETLPAKPKSPYALHKYIGEKYCELYTTLYNLSTVSLRYFNVYGPGARTTGAYVPAVSFFLQQRVAGTPITITGDGEQTRDFVHVRDVAQANILAAESPKVGRGEAINIGSGKNVSMNYIARLVGGSTTHVAPRIEPRDSLADISRAQKLLNWEPTVSLEEGVQELKLLHKIV